MNRWVKNHNLLKEVRGGTEGEGVGIPVLDWRGSQKAVTIANRRREKRELEDSGRKWKRSWKIKILNRKKSG